MGWVSILEATIPGRPVAWKRAGHTDHFYDRQETQKRDLALMVSITMKRGGVAIQSGPLKLDTEFGYWNKTPKRRHPVWRVERHDLDNLQKFIGDALEGVLWENDSQIVAGENCKLWAASNYTRLAVSTWKDDE